MSDGRRIAYKVIAVGLLVLSVTRHLSDDWPTALICFIGAVVINIMTEKTEKRDE